MECATRRSRRRRDFRDGSVTAFAIVVMMATTVVRPTAALDTSQCVGALGMESGAIRDEDIAASSSFDGASVGPHNARVRVERNGGAWCPRQQATHQPRDWLEIDLKTDHVITAVETQGRFGNGQGQEFAEHFLLEYWRESLAKWVRYKDIKGEEVIAGNTNTYVAEKRELDPVLIARKLRFFPYSHHRRTVCMRVEIYGCPWSEGIASYLMPQGDQRGAGWQFYDTSYDGIWDGSLLRQGLGQLTDGKLGPDNFKASYYDQDRGWVGWRNDSRNGQPVEIVFEFDTVRDFTSLSIFANNQFTKDVQIFSEMQVHFSVGGQVYPGEPIIYRPPEDRIFENSRNISVKLHHRVGRYVKLRLSFPAPPARWILISEVSFRSEIAARNYTTEVDGSPVTPPAAAPNPPVSHLPLPPTGHEVGINAGSSDQTNETSPPTRENQTYMAIIVGVLVAVSFLLAAAIIFMMMRRRQRKNLSGSPLPDKANWASQVGSQPSPRLLDGSVGEHHEDQLLQHHRGKIYNKNNSLPYGNIGADLSRSDAASQYLLPHSPASAHLTRTEYQEPYHALRFSPYYSYSTLLLAGTEGPMKKINTSAVSDTYDYAVPDISGISSCSTAHQPLLIQPVLQKQQHPHQPKLPAVSPPSMAIEIDTLASSSHSTTTNGSASSSSVRLGSGKNNNQIGHYNGISESSPLKKPADRAELLSALKSRAESLVIPELSRSKLHVIQRIASGAFGTVYKAEAEHIPEYGNTVYTSRRLVAAKYLPNTSEKDKSGFYQEVRLLAALDDPHLSRVLAVCTTEEPFCVVLEYLDYGDLNQFLKLHRFRPDHQVNSSDSRNNISKTFSTQDETLTMGSLIFIASQIASGMRYLESLNFVHRDLAARNCLVGKGLQIKICDFGTDSDIYGLDYYRSEDQTLGLPVRWMAWESVIQGKYTTKSDVWSFAVTLWEILVLARQRPYQEFSDETVVENLQRFAQGTISSAPPCVSLSRPQHCPRDIYDLMCECWRRLPTERPSFREIHLFLQRKNLGYSSHLE
uniref:receptor protein-tyrosine kinase n=1 Tax=Daphnia galeata TaxID=27404 RepID=A0A8J2RW35_9CRUS|nr:unnamed protein product [Daphnia galeata]